VSGDDGNRTEAATEQRLRHAREEGQVALGHDAPLVAGLGAAAIVLVAGGTALRTSLVALFREAAGSVGRAPFQSLPGLLARPALLVAAASLAGAAAAAAVTLGQTQGGFWPHLAAPDVSRLAQGGRLRRVVSLDVLVDLGLALAKVSAVLAAVWMGAKDELLGLGAVARADVPAQLHTTFGILTAAAKPALLAAVALATVELVVSRLRFAKKMRMTKDEVKREVKEEEGDPLLRGARRRRHRDISKGVARVEVPRADALLVNPTHIAIALRYRRDEGRAPRVTAKGKGALAEYMRELARENAIPIVEDIPLARLLYRKVKVGREVPSQTYKAVAAILAFVYRATGKRPGGARA
jgi:flagellar biosynthesis protein FlhB